MRKLFWHPFFKQKAFFRHFFFFPLLKLFFIQLGKKTQIPRGHKRLQSWALEVFFKFFNFKKRFFAFFNKLILLGVGFLNSLGAEIKIRNLNRLLGIEFVKKMV